MLTRDKDVYTEKVSLQSHKAQQVLPMTKAILEKYDLTLQDLTAIHVNTGPGSFTGLRVGIAIANCLGYLLKIPVNGKEIGQTVDAVYT